MHENGFEFEANLKHYQRAVSLITSLACSIKEIKKAECIVELYKQAGIFKNTREVRRSTSRRRVLLALLECS